MRGERRSMEGGSGQSGHEVSFKVLRLSNLEVDLDVEMRRTADASARKCGSTQAW